MCVCRLGWFSRKTKGSGVYTEFLAVSIHTRNSATKNFLRTIYSLFSLIEFTFLVTFWESLTSQALFFCFCPTHFHPHNLKCVFLIRNYIRIRNLCHLSPSVNILKAWKTPLSPYTILYCNYEGKVFILFLKSKLKIILKLAL